VTSLLVVAGEASGDRAAAAVIDRLPGVRAFGLGGASLQSRGVELLDDLRDSTALGVGEVGLRAVGVLRSWHRVTQAIRARRPRAALLVNYTEYNALLAPRLQDFGARVLWYGAPQVWAWRPDRASSLRTCVDRMAVMLPFEEAIWRANDVDARYVGHPALETDALDREAARLSMGMTPYAAAVAILPGSRPHEVKRLLKPMLEGYEIVRSDRASVDARVLLAPSLDAGTRRWARAACADQRVEVVDADPRFGATRILRAFDVALCASGTASLEAALARAIPVVVYKVGLTTEIAARALLRTEHIALPNILLEKRAFTELVQNDVRAEPVAQAVADALDRRMELLGACSAVEASLAFGTRKGDSRLVPSLAVAGLLAPWVGVRAQAA
jgi:lipid-A-disaccharide synthase